MGESALVDKETGRIFWEGGSSSTLSASVGPKIEQFGILHAKATFLSGILLIAALGPFCSFLRKKLEEKVTSKSIPRILSISVVVINWSILNVPEFRLWFVSLTAALYLFEAYTCSTRRYLANAIQSPKELEAFLDKLRQEPPQVEWKIRSFHYEKPLWLSPQRNFQKQQQLPDDDATATSERPIGSSSSNSLLRRKVVTNQAIGSYQYKHCTDKTTVGVWKRAPASTSMPAPFTKMTLTKLLVLSNQKARQDYFEQQSSFVTEHGQGDEFAEFSTSIQVADFRPRMLAIRPVLAGVPLLAANKFFRSHLFWIFTLLGLTVPYRIWFSRHCDELRVTVVKETAAEPPVSPSRSWLFSSRTATTEPTSPTSDDGKEGFRSVMQQLKLYAQQETSPEQQIATAKVLKDVEAASIAADLTDVNDLAVVEEVEDLSTSDRNETAVDESEVGESEAAVDTNTTDTNATFTSAPDDNANTTKAEN